ncbi:uncharacterized protein LOC117176195 [Belonocnema kinseyi]|uniref:uncharacterized protein LOC117176195 n=1 Tax=Belonocnema kinseyi TaxID=2817044 RepID=UPI00143DFBE8|nr:uncharacterized protein LOC117176195 [Belonocnema kinseyi]XP_033222206.1 uncharacterized protein LOC117176195 [Belonocnema kinseyi]
MGRKCVVLGCKSGYDSNKKRFHMFVVPKKPAAIEQWQKAILRKDITLKHKHAVCEKHFFKSDIVWGAEVRGPDGKVMSAIKYKIPRLRVGAVPQIFPNQKLANEKRRRSLKKGNNSKSAETKSSPPEELNPNVSTALNNVKIEDTEVKESNEIENNEMKVNYVFANCNPYENTLFETIFNCSESVKFSASWARHNITFGNSKMIQFSQCTAKLVKDSIEPVTSKQVAVRDNMEIWIAIFGKPIELEEFGTETSLSSAESIEKILDIVNKWELCQGYCNSGDNNCYENSETHIDKEGFLRHSDCTYVLGQTEHETDRKMCKACYSAIETVSRKKTKVDQDESLGNTNRIKLLNVTKAQQRKSAIF